MPAALGGRGESMPRGFFGVAPQTTLTSEDASYMKAGGIETVRWPMVWAEIQPTAEGGYDWSAMDGTMAIAARAGLRVLPSVGGTPSWLARGTTLPVQTARQRAAWVAFLRAAVQRYGPGGEFWREHDHEVVTYEPQGPNYEPQPVKREPALPAMPIREWQVWNEPNFFYFAYPVSPTLYAKLVKLSSRAIRGASPGARVVLAGLFGKPTAGGRRGMAAVRFLEGLYRTPGIKKSFDGVALHPYAIDTPELEALVEAVHDVIVKNRDHAGLYVTEMGWGSQNDFNRVAFEQGARGQVRELRRAYRYLIGNRRRLNLKQVDWFSWKDLSGACNFCDSVGLFREGTRFSAKPAWRAFLSFTGGRARP